MLLRETHTKSDRGSAMVAVLGVLAVTMIIAVTVTTASVNALAFTSSTRAGIQSVAAAESGVNVVEVALRQNTCAATYSRGTAPAFSGTVSYSLHDSGDSWISGCPAIAVNAKRIKVVSTGVASSLGVAGNTSGDSTVVEAIYEVEALPGIQPSGAAMYVHGGVVFENNGDLLVSEDGRPAIQVKDGDMECSNNTVIEGDVVVESGDMDIIACSIEGNAWASGSAELGRITGNLTASSVNIPLSTLHPTYVGGTYTQSGPIPAVPAWIDFTYVPGDWKDDAGVAFKVTPIASDCTLNAAMLATAANGTKPVIIDALACPGGVKANGLLKLTNDLVIFSNQFNFDGPSGLQFESSSASAERRLWFITPDNTPDNLPTCGAGQGDFVMKNGFEIRESVKAMLYTPCRFEAMNNFEWRGQLYANGANDFKNNTWFDYAPLGLPGIDLDTGLPPEGGAIGSDAKLGELLTIRDLASGP